MKPVLPCLKELALEQWKVVFYEDYTSLFMKGDTIDLDFKNSLIPYLEDKFHDYRTQLKFKGVSFLVGFFHRDKEIRFYSPRLNFEFTVLQGNKEFSEIPEFVALKRHTDKVASLPPGQFPTVLAELTERFKLPDLFRDQKYRDVQSDITSLKEKLVRSMDHYRPSLLERMTDLGLELVTRFQGIRIHLLKFLTSLPALEHDQSREGVKKLLQESLRRLVDATFKRKQGHGRLENWLPMGLAYASHLLISLLRYIPAKIISFFLFIGIKIMAKRFIAGASLEKSEKAMRRLYKTKRDATLDQLGETVLTEADAEGYLQKCLVLIRGFSKYANKGEVNSSQIYKANVSVKVTALSSIVEPNDFTKTYASIGPRLKSIFMVAREEKVFINVDAEHYRYRDLVFQIYKKVLLDTPELHDYAGVGIVVQAYLRDAYPHFLEIVELAKERKLIMPIRLVKGAYWDAETLEAEAHNLPAWHFLNKEETDLHFRQIIYKILENYPHVQLAVASHNYADHCYAEALKNKFFKNHPPVEHQCLDMTYEALSTGMARMGWVVRNYVPVGDYLVGMAYFVRRILENSSQVGILSQMRSGDDLLSFPTPEEIYLERLKKGEMRQDQVITDLTARYVSFPAALFYMENERKHLTYGACLKLHAPTHLPEDLVAELESLEKNYHESGWSRASVLVRASYFFRLVSLLDSRKKDLVATLHAHGFSLTAALRELELITDSLSFYAREEILFMKKNPQALSRGVWVVVNEREQGIASLVGAWTAALMTGNSTLVLVEEKNLALLNLFAELFKEVGIPQNVFAMNKVKDPAQLKQLAGHRVLAGMVYLGHRSQGLPLANEIGRNLHEYDLEICQTQFLGEFGMHPMMILGFYADLSDSLAAIKTLPSDKGLKILVPNTMKELLLEKARKTVTGDVEKWEIHTFENLYDAVNLVNSFDCVGQTLINSESQDEIDYLREFLEVPNMQVNKKFGHSKIGEYPDNTMKLGGSLWRLGGKNMIDHFHIIPRQLIETQLPIEGRGSDYQFRPARPSEQNIFVRFEALTKALDSLVQNFEVLFPGVYGENKENLMGLRSWIKDHFLRYRLGYRLNVPLSHLMNADDCRLAVEEVLVLAFNERPHFTVFMQTLGALSMGSGVTIVTRSQQSFEWWTRVRDLFFRAGFIKSNFDVFFPTKELMEKTLRHPCLGAVVFDGNFETLKKLLPLIYDENALEKKRVRRLLTAYDAPSDNDYERLLMQFTQLRSMSVNIMRQGAQMEVDTLV